MDSFFYMVKSTFETLYWILQLLCSRIFLFGFFVLFCFQWLCACQTCHFVCATVSLISLVIYVFLQFYSTCFRGLFWVLWQIIDIHFFQVSYWSVISFLWCCYIDPFFHDLWFIMLVSVHLSTWTHLVDFVGLLWQTQLLLSQLSLGLWVGFLVMTLGRWNMLLWSLSGQGKYSDSQEGDRGMYSWLRTAGQDCLLGSLPKWSSRMGSTVDSSLWSGFLLGTIFCSGWG